MSRPRGTSSPRLEIPRKSVELEDPGAINLRMCRSITGDNRLTHGAQSLQTKSIFQMPLRAGEELQDQKLQLHLFHEQG